MNTLSNSGKALDGDIALLYRMLWKNNPRIEGDISSLAAILKKYDPKKGGVSYQR